MRSCLTGLGRHLPSLPFARFPRLGLRGVVATVVLVRANVRACEWCFDCRCRLAPCFVHRTVDTQPGATKVMLSGAPRRILCCLPVQRETDAFSQLPTSTRRLARGVGGPQSMPRAPTSLHRSRGSCGHALLSDPVHAVDERGERLS